jgi:HEAT repeat protein
VGTIAASVLDDYLNAFGADAPSFSRRIRELLHSAPDVFVAEAAAVLRDAPDTPAIEYLLALLAANALLARILLDPDFPRAQAIRLTRMMTRTDAAAPLKMVNIGGGLIRSVQRSPAAALGALELIGATVDSVLATGVVALFLNIDNAQVRSKAALLLGRAHRNLAWVRQKLRDPDPRIRANAVESIWGVTGAEAVALFAEAMRDEHNRVVGNACLGLFLCGQPAATEALVEMSRRSEPTFRATAAWVMGETGADAFVHTLETLREDADPDVRHAALAATTRIRRARAG